MPPSSMQRPTLALICFWLAYLLGGCSTLALSPDALKVTVSNIEVAEATLMEQLYRVTLRIQNRTDQSLTLTGGSFDLEINGREFGSGVTDESVTIPPFSDAQVDVRMVSTVFGIVRLIQGLQDRDGEPLAYEISGRFSTDALVPLSFNQSGEFALPESPNAGLE